MRGRKPKPTSLKLLAGNPGKRTLNRSDLRAEPTVPNCPLALSEEARREWKQISRQLAKLGLLTQVDRAALAAYCQWYARWLKAERMLAQQGEIVKGARTRRGKSEMVRNPWLIIANQAWQHVHKLLVEFGMTPSSRSRVPISIPASPEEDERARKTRELISLRRSISPRM